MADFINWSLLSNDIKKKVINFLDYESRCSLRCCSKSEQSLVDSTEFRASKVKLEEIESRRVSDKTIIRIDIDTFSVWFIGKNDVTRVERGWNGEFSSEYSQLKLENRHTVAKCFLETLFRKGPLSADAVCIESLNIEPEEEWRLNCSSLETNRISHGNSYLWMETLIDQPKYKSIVISGSDAFDDVKIKLPIPSKVLNASQKLKIAYCLLITDEQFDSIEAMDLELNVQNVTPDAVKKKLRKFLEHGRMSDEFDICVHFPKEFDFKSLLPDDVSVRSFNHIYFEEKFELTLNFANKHGVQEDRIFTVECFRGYQGIACYVKSIYKQDIMERTLW